MDDLQMLCTGAGDSFAVHFVASKVCKYCGKELSPSNFFKSGQFRTAFSPFANHREDSSD